MVVEGGGGTEAEIKTHSSAGDISRRRVTCWEFDIVPHNLD